MKVNHWTILLGLMLGATSCSKLPFLKKEKKGKIKKVVREFGPNSVNDSNFQDVTDSLGLAGQSAVHIYAVDFNNDGSTDLVTLPTYYSQPRFFSFDKKSKKFKKVPSPLPEGVMASYLVFLDIDKDYDLDLIVGVLNQKTELTKRPLRLFINEKNYREVSKPIDRIKINPTAAINILDYNLDGRLDLFEGNWFSTKNGNTLASPDRILTGRGKQIKDVSYLLEGEYKFDKDLNVYPNARPTFGVGICDIDQNGYPDILTSSSDGMSNKLWLNLYDSKNKDRIFKDFGRKTGFASDEQGSLDKKGGGNSFFSVCTDYNNDGIIDVLTGELTRVIDNDKRDRSSILTGSSPKFPPKFIRTEYYMDDGSINWNQGDRRGVWLDYNNDGLVDALVENSGFPMNSRLILFSQDKWHAFGDVAKTEGINIVNPAGAVSVDFNGDGKMDIISGQTTLRAPDMKPRIYAFKNVGTYKGKSIRVYLRAKKANTFGIGSTVEFATNKSIQKRFVEYTNGALPSQNEEGIHFGVPSGELPKEFRIRWPLKKKNGKVQRWGYDIPKIKGNYAEFTACDDGRLLRGKKKSCP